MTEELKGQIKTFKKKWKVSVDYMTDLKWTKKYLTAYIVDKEYISTELLKGTVEKNFIVFDYVAKKCPFFNPDFIAEFKQLLVAVEKEL